MRFPVLPAHNEADVVRAPIEVLLAQERPLDRIVVVSDNSTDDTFAMARSYPGVTAIETLGNVHRKSGALTAAWLRFAPDADRLARRHLHHDRRGLVNPAPA